MSGYPDLCKSFFSFVLIQKKQKIKSVKRLLCAPGLCTQAKKTWAAIFCPASHANGLASAKFAMPCQRARPALFSTLLAEAYLPTGCEHNLGFNINS